MLRNIDYQMIAKDKGIYLVCEMDLDYNLYVERLNPSNMTLNAYSIAKTFTSTATGMCIDQGLLDINDKFIDIMEIDFKSLKDFRWENVTIDMLLKHEVGFAESILDIDCDDVSSYGTNDYLKYVLSHSLSKQYIEAVYTDAAFYLLGRVVEKVSGKTLYDFLRPTLMIDLGFKEYAWSSCPLGHTMGGTGLYIRCEDMIKLGVVYLNGGVYKDKRIVSEEWCNKVLEEGYALHDYGDGWYVKGGMLGQFLAININTKIAVAWMGYSKTIDNLEMLGINK